MLPVPVVFVHALLPILDTSTGHNAEECVLSVAFEHELFKDLDFFRIDPSDALESFVHAMRFKKTKGFSPVEALSPDDADL